MNYKIFDSIFYDLHVFMLFFEMHWWWEAKIWRCRGFWDNKQFLFSVDKQIYSRQKLVSEKSELVWRDSRSAVWMQCLSTLQSRSLKVW